MNLTEISELTAYVVGTGLFGLALNKARKKYVSWAEKNKFYDKGVKFSDLEKKGSPNFNPQELKKMECKNYANSVSLS